MTDWSVLCVLSFVPGPWSLVFSILDSPSSILGRWSFLLLDASLKSAFLFLAAALVAQALRRGSAATRHAVWCLALAGAVALPLLSRVLPAWHSLLWPSFSIPQQPWRPSVAAAMGSAGIEAARFDWLAWIGLVWLVVALLLFGRMLRSYLLLMKTVREAEPAGCERCLSSLREAAARLGQDQRRALAGSSRGKRRQPGCCRPALPRWSGKRLPAQSRQKAPAWMLPALLVSPRIEVPLVCRVLKPAILLPPDFAEWPEERRQAVLLHELAHVRRRDPLLELAARSVAILHWFNPLVWMAARALREESERACDDYVLARGVKPSDYARELLELAWTLGLSEGPPLAVALARRSQLHGRVMAILDAGRARQPLTRRRSLLAVFAAAVFLAPLAALQGPEAARQIPDRLLERSIARPAAFHNLASASQSSAAPKLKTAPLNFRHRQLPAVVKLEQSAEPAAFFMAGRAGAVGGATLLLASYELVDEAPASPSFVAVEEFESGRHVVLFVTLQPARLLVITWVEPDDGPRQQPLKSRLKA